MRCSNLCHLYNVRFQSAPLLTPTIFGRRARASQPLEHVVRNRPDLDSKDRWRHTECRDPRLSVLWDYYHGLVVPSQIHSAK